jgi:hypothetical protein
VEQNLASDLQTKWVLAPHILVALVEVGGLLACLAVVYCVRRFDKLIGQAPAMTDDTRSALTGIILRSGRCANVISVLVTAATSGLVWTVIVPQLELPALTGVSLGVVVGGVGFGLTVAGFSMVVLVLSGLFRARRALLDGLVYVPTSRSGGLAPMMRFLSIVVSLWGLLSSLLVIVGQRVLVSASTLPESILWIAVALLVLDVLCTLGMCAVWVRAQWWAHTKYEELRSALIALAWERGPITSPNALACLSLLDSARRAGYGSLAFQVAGELASVFSLGVAIWRL